MTCFFRWQESYCTVQILSLKHMGLLVAKQEKIIEATAHPFTVTPNPRRTNGDEVRMSCSEDSGSFPIYIRSVASYNSAYERIRSNMYYCNTRNEVHMSSSEDSGFSTHNSNKTFPIKIRSVTSNNSAYERIRSNDFYRDARNADEIPSA